MSQAQSIIAKAIKSADSSYFWEDYSAQAKAAIRALEAAGFAIVPKDPSLPMVQAGVQAVVIGKTKPQELATQIYRGMVKAGKA